MFDSGWERGPTPAPSRTWSTEIPCAALATALTTVAPVDPADDEGFDAVERIGAWEAIAAWATARQVHTAADLLAVRQGRAASTGVAQHDQFAATAMELSTMARVAPATGEHRLYQAVCLVERLPLTLEALAAGRIAYSHARVLVEQTHDCDDSSATSVDARFWGGPGAQNLERTPTQTRERVRRIIQRLDPEALRRRVKAAASGRTVRYWSDDDGATGVISLRLPADQARGVFAVIDAAANAAADPPETPRDQRRTLGNRRADATVDLIMNGVTAGTTDVPAPDEPAPARPETGTDEPAPDEPAPARPAPDEPAPARPAPARPAPAGPAPARPEADEPAPAGPASGEHRTSPADAGKGACRVRSRPAVSTQVRVLVPWETLAGHSDQPAELEGHGPLPADLARRLAAGADSVLQRLLVDPVTGIARHFDLTRYRPPPSLRGFVEDRDQYCHAPGCRRSARACDLDHVIAYDHTAPDGGAGRTRPDGLRPECRRHHNLKTRCHWHCAPHREPGEPPAVLWTSPSGHSWIVRSPSLTEPDLDRLTGDDTADEVDHEHPADEPRPQPPVQPPRRHPDFLEHPGPPRC